MEESPYKEYALKSENEKRHLRDLSLTWRGGWWACVCEGQDGRTQGKTGEGKRRYRWQVLQEVTKEVDGGWGAAKGRARKGGDGEGMTGPEGQEGCWAPSWTRLKDKL